MPDELIAAALAAREMAYVPYSGYRVGAAVLDEQGRIHSGCNVENVSFGATICAERNAIGRLIAEGGKRVRALAIATEDGGTPCGICLQVLAEFCDDPDELQIACAGIVGSAKTFKLAELLPCAFSSQAVPRTT